MNATYTRPLIHTMTILFLLLLLQVKKLQDRVSKAREDVSRAKDRYEAALIEIAEYNPKYMEEMTIVFAKAQQVREARSASETN